LGQCSAFCAQIIGTDKCETIRNEPNTVTNVCPARAISGDCTKCAPFEGIDVLDKEYYKCKCPTKCPYSAESIENECKPFSYFEHKPPVVKNQELFNVKIPDTQCPVLKNFSTKGIPAFQTNTRLSGAYNPLSSVTCQNACACNNSNEGFAPPSCAYYDPAVYPGPTACCYCYGNQIAYDKEKFDSCGMFLPIFGKEVLPSQSECYKEYANNDPLRLIDNFPPFQDFYCAKDTDDSGICTDTPNWTVFVSAANRGCSYFAADTARCTKNFIQNTAGTDQLKVNQACCACGKGN